MDHPEISQEGITIFDDSVGEGFNTVEMQSGSCKGKNTLRLRTTRQKAENPLTCCLPRVRRFLHGLSFEAAKRD